MNDFQNLIDTFTKTIFPWSYYCDFKKISTNAFSIKVSLNILNSLLGEDEIEERFIELIKEYPKIREHLLILLAVRDDLKIILDEKTKVIKNIGYLFDSNKTLNEEQEKELLSFFIDSGLKDIFKNSSITNLNDYVFGIETGLDSNARKNRSGKLMEKLVEDFIKDFCTENGYKYKAQATSKLVEDNWGIKIKNDKSNRIFDFVVFDGKKVFVFETNFYGGGGSKLKSVAGEFSNLYKFLGEQGIQMFWVTDGLGWQSSLKPLEEAYNSTDGNIYNLEMLKGGILNKLIK